MLYGCSMQMVYPEWLPYECNEPILAVIIVSEKCKFSTIVKPFAACNSVCVEFAYCYCLIFLQDKKGFIFYLNLFSGWNEKR